ncbi:MAG: hypothetical protein KAU95_03715 [Candidatus Aenigmarchaeota archaeon]|nr:hypothetical protein [Candidatus Aenigmarchaeota archaeon]
MGILSLRLKKIGGDVGEIAAGELKVTSALPKITEIKEKDVSVGGNKMKVLAISFEYKTKYEPIKAKIEVEGEVMYTDQNQKEIVKKWSKDKKVDEEFALPILNYIFKRCAVQSIKIADDLQLPAPVRLPEFVKKQ